MNIVDYIIIAILAYGLLSGMYKGTITSGLSTFGFAAAWWGAQSVYQRIANYALSNTTLMAVLNQYLEPDTFFTDHAQAVMTVKEVIAGGEEAISKAVNSVSGTFGFISEAFSANVRNQAFEKLGIDTLAQYLDQTLWMAIFNVVAFIGAFVVIYVVISLLVNMLDRVIRFPMVRGLDWLFGGVLGVLRSSVVVVLVLSILPALTSVISPELTEELTTNSVLYMYAKQFDVLQVGNWINTLIRG